jgi:hypothetical protein
MKVVGVKVIFIKLHRFIARQFGAFNLVVKGMNYRILNLPTAVSIDRMCDIGMQFHSPLRIMMNTVFRKLGAAITAEFGSQVIFTAAAAAVVAHLAGGHGNKQPSGSFDDFDVPDDKLIIEGHRAKGF